MNMQNKVYTIQFSSPLNDQLTASPGAQSQKPWKVQIPKKFRTPRQEMIQTHRRERSR